MSQRTALQFPHFLTPSFPVNLKPHLQVPYSSEVQKLSTSPHNFPPFAPHSVQVNTPPPGPSNNVSMILEREAVTSLHCDPPHIS